MRRLGPALLLVSAIAWCSRPAISAPPTTLPAAERAAISGRYPHLAMFNYFNECGTGAVVPWAGRLWVITYAPHEPNGSDDKLYEIDADLNQIIRPESVGGTPADRLIHDESNQLIIGSHVIDAQGRVRTVPLTQMPGRMTAAARHLIDPANKVYVYDMEGMLYELDVHTLASRLLFQRAAPAAHGKGAYTGQGRLVVANNGTQIINKAPAAANAAGLPNDPESAGSLAEWDGTKWTLLQRRQFTDITGPGGIHGSPSADAPVWALGWDKRSVLLQSLDGGVWRTFRLPIADYSYVAGHGWYTEWPRIREIGDGPLLMNMHGGWFDFPKTFSATNTAGIRPIADYLKITGDFANWNGRLVFGCDDASMLGNPLLGQSQSNLWFTTRADLKKAGKPSAAGGPWVDDAMKAGVPSDPYLLAGYDEQRVVHVWHDSDQPVDFTLEVDVKGDGHWTVAETITTKPGEYTWRILPATVTGEWVRVKANRDCRATVYFNYGPGGGAITEPGLLTGLADADRPVTSQPAELRPMSENGELLVTLPDGKRHAVDVSLKPRPFDGIPPTTQYAPSKFMPVTAPIKFSGAGYTLSSDPASLVFTLGKERFRLPVAADALNTPAAVTAERHLRELVTERYMLNAGGSFFVVPAPTAGGIRRMKPVTTHGKRIDDFCSWRGLTVLAGYGDADGPHTRALGDGRELWLGDVDDLWRSGKPRGHGGPWLNTPVVADAPSDPYLMNGYDGKKLTITNEGDAPAKYTVEVDVRGDGEWHKLTEFASDIGLAPKQSMTFTFPAGYSAHWVRVRSGVDGRASAQLEYD